MDTKLHKAALTGDVDSLVRLLGEDALILDKADGVAETPLHVASLYGHVEFAKAILRRKKQLARALDSHQSSPLHLASAKGHVEVVKELLNSDPGMCFARDQDGMTPLHAAALKGRVDVVKELVGKERMLTRVLTNQREPILHLCVNHERFEIVKALLECAGDDEEFVKMKDDNDNTLLHLSVAKKHILVDMKESSFEQHPQKIRFMPLHIASLCGHVEFATAILSKKPELARVLDSHQSAPLHLASLKGHVEVVEELLQSNPGMCLARDQDGMTPLHAAALKGRVDVVKELVRAKSIVTRVLTNQREPILHFCVNHDRFEIVKALLECAGDDDEFMKMKDEDDNTILHVSVAKKHILLTKFLLKNPKMREEVNALNVNGSTAMDVFRANNSKSSKDIQLKGILRNAGAKRANAIPLPKDSWEIRPPSKDEWKKHADWLSQTRSTLMVVSILIATVTFQAGLNPPGGVWQDDNVKKERTAGESIMSDLYPETYIGFTVFNVVAFLSSLVVILLLIGGFSLRRRIFMWALMIVSWVAVSSMVVTYGLAFYTLSTDEVLGYVEYGIERKIRASIWIVTWLLLFSLLFIMHIGRLIRRWCREIRTITFRKEPPSKKNAGHVDVESRIKYPATQITE